MSEQTYYCAVSNKPIPSERVEALKMLGTPEHQWTCVEHSMVRPRQGIFLGEHGTSQLLFVDKVYDSTVRSIFKGGEESGSSEDTQDEPVKFYTQKEIKYYSEDDDSDRKQIADLENT
jgi:hypothetical protein